MAPSEDAAFDQENVQRVEQILSELGVWDDFFPFRNSVYSYESFLGAVARYPYFCNRNPAGQTKLTVCKKELVTFFAHVVLYTTTPEFFDGTHEQGLRFTHNQACSNDAEYDGCYNIEHSDAFEEAPNK